MNRKEFMKALQSALCDVSSEEKEEALQYYNDYLDDAGPENEQKVLEEWGSPEKLAESIRNGMDGKFEDGEFTEKGFSTGEERQCPVKRKETAGEEQEGCQTGKPDKRHRINGWKWLAIGLLCIFLAPVCIPAAMGLIAVIFGLILAAAAVIAAFIAVGIVLFAVGICVAVIGVGKVFAVPSAAAVLFGIGLIVSAIGALFVLLFGWVLVKFVIVLFRALVKLCRKPFHSAGKAGASE